MRFALSLIAVAFATLTTPAAFSATAGGAGSPDVPARWLGEWTGVLEYRDYQPPHRRVTLPTTLSVVRAADDPHALTLRFVYDDGPGKTVKSSSRLALDLAARRLLWSDEGKAPQPENTFSLTDASADSARLVFVGTQRDDNKPSRVRYTFTLEGKAWTILKETTSDGPEFAFRHEYRFTRKD